jgi:photoactive yellow protein
MTFNTKKPLQSLESMNQQAMDDLDFGVIRMDRNGKIKAYNTYELNLSGNHLEEVLGKHFFKQVAPCTNNFMVAEKYHTDQHLDEEIDYIFTYRMQPTKVKLRMLAEPGLEHQYLLVKKS